jgi:hypothetical protein
MLNAWMTVPIGNDAATEVVPLWWIDILGALDRPRGLAPEILRSLFRGERRTEERAAA